MMKNLFLALSVWLSLCCAVSEQAIAQSPPNTGSPMVPNGGGSATVSAPLALNPTASSLISGFVVTQSYDGTPTGSTTGNPNFWGNFINVTSDDAAVTSTNTAAALTIMHSFGGTNMTGGRDTLSVYSNFTAQTSASNANRNYVSGLFDAKSTATDGGTNNTSGALGALFGINPQGILLSGATNWKEVTAGEADFAAATGSSVKYKFGWSIVQGPNDGVAAGSAEAMLEMSGQAGATVGLGNGILVCDCNGQHPLASTGTLLNILGLSSTPTIANGVVLTGATISGNAFASSNFAVTGGGLVNLAAAGSTTNPTISFGTCGTNCGILAPASGQLEFITAGANMLDINVTTATRITVHERLDLATNLLSNVGGEILVAAAPTVGASQIGLGSTTAAASSCGGALSVPPNGCMVINVAGTTRNVPFY